LEVFLQRGGRGRGGFNVESISEEKLEGFVLGFRFLFYWSSSFFLFLGVLE
jgi:hypothetical protein